MTVTDPNYLPPPPGGIPPPPQQVAMATPAPPLPPPVPPAVAARKRKDAKKDVATRIGRKVLSQAPPQGKPPTPPPPQNSTTDAPPQMAAPPSAAQYIPPELQQAVYKAPPKGLEYLALGLGLLFPGAPIARMAAGFAGGLNQGAQQSYERNEQQAQDANANATAAAQAKFQNDQAQRQALEDQQKVAFQNATIKYETNEKYRAQGTDPATGRPFVVPQALQRILPPGTKRAPTSTDYAAHENALATFYTSVGATDVAKQHAEAAEEYNKRAIDEANNARALMISMNNQAHADARAYAHDSTEVGIANARIGTEWAIHNDSEYHEDLRARERQYAPNPKEMAAVRDQAMVAGKDFYQNWAKAIKPPTNADGSPKLDASGNPLPPAISQQNAAVLGKAFSTIDRDSDPAGTAQHFADSITDPEQKELLLERGRVGDLTRRSKGLPVIPHAYASAAKPATVKTGDVPPGIPPNLAKGFKSLPPEAQDSITQALNNGQTIDQVIATAQQHGLADVVHALSPPAAPLTQRQVREQHAAAAIGGLFAPQHDARHSRAPQPNP